MSTNLIRFLILSVRISMIMILASPLICVIQAALRQYAEDHEYVAVKADTWSAEYYARGGR